MEEANVLGGQSLQSRITDFFHTLHVPLTEPESYCPFHQSLITDYFREIDLSIVVSHNFSDGGRILPVLSKSVMQSLTYTQLETRIPFSAPQTPTSKFVPSNSDFTHVSESPKIRLGGIRAQTMSRHSNITQDGCLVQRNLW